MLKLLLKNSSRLLPLVALLGAAQLTRAQSVGIGTTTPDASAALEITSSSKGVLLPRVAGIGSVSSPVQGLIVYQTGSPAGYYYYDGSAWQRLTAASGTGDFVRNQLTQQTGTNFNVSGNGTVGTATVTGNATIGGTATVGPPRAPGQVLTPATGTHNMLATAYGQFNGLGSNSSASFTSTSGNYSILTTSGTSSGAYQVVVQFSSGSGFANTDLSTYPVVASRLDAPGFVLASGSVGIGFLAFTIYNTTGALNPGKFNFVMYQP